VHQCALSEFFQRAIGLRVECWLIVLREAFKHLAGDQMDLRDCWAVFLRDVATFGLPLSFNGECSLNSTKREFEMLSERQTMRRLS
jgi:hypothetical protein